MPSFSPSDNKHILYVEVYGNKVKRYKLSGIMGVVTPDGNEMLQPYEGDALVTSIKFDEVRYVGPHMTRSDAGAGPLNLTGYSQDRDMRNPRG